MKRKFLVLTLCFTVFFSSINFKRSYSYDEIDSLSIPPVLVKIAPEVFSVLIGFAIEAGINFVNEKQATDYVKGVYLKADSGVFSTSPASKPIETALDLEETLLDDIKISSTGKLILGTTSISLLGYILNKTFTSSGSNEYVYTFNNIPIYPNLMPIPQESDLVLNFKDVYYGYKPNLFDNPYYDTFNYNLDYNENEYRYYYELYGNDSLIKNSYFNSSNYKDSSFTLKYTSGDYAMLYYYKNNSLYGDQPIYTRVNKVNGFLNTSNVSSDKEYDYYKKPSVSDSELEFKNPIGSSSDDNIPELPNNKPLNPPSFPNLSDLDFGAFDFSSLGSLFDNFKNKFPFSIPFDIYNIIDSLSVEPVAPKFEAPLFGEVIELDLTEFNELANIVRMFVVLGWVFVLFTFTKKIGG